METNKIKDNSLLPTLLLIAFIVLKLCGVINWSWWWVISPFWIPLALAAIGFVVFLYFEDKREKKQRLTLPKSKWQERLEEMQQRREQMNKRKEQEMKN